MGGGRGNPSYCTHRHGPGREGGREEAREGGKGRREEREERGEGGRREGGTGRREGRGGERGLRKGLNLKYF